MGYRIITVCPDKPEDVKKLKEKRKLAYTMLSDSSMKGARAYGLAFKLNDNKLKEKLTGKVAERASGEKHHQLPVPAVFIIGKDQVVDYVYTNPDYSVRIEPEELLKEAEKAAK